MKRCWQCRDRNAAESLPHTSEAPEQPMGGGLGLTFQRRPLLPSHPTSSFSWNHSLFPSSSAPAGPADRMPLLDHTALAWSPPPARWPFPGRSMLQPLQQHLPSCPSAGCSSRQPLRRHPQDSSWDLQGVPPPARACSSGLSSGHSLSHSCKQWTFSQSPDMPLTSLPRLAWGPLLGALVPLWPFTILIPP